MMKNKAEKKNKAVKNRVVRYKAAIIRNINFMRLKQAFTVIYTYCKSRSFLIYEYFFINMINGLHWHYDMRVDWRFCTRLL